jgi:hypothetical protein
MSNDDSYINLMLLVDKLAHLPYELKSLICSDLLCLFLSFLTNSDKVVAIYYILMCDPHHICCLSSVPLLNTPPAVLSVTIGQTRSYQTYFSR